jgi:phage antirepressor YoqD-like protein
MNELTNEKTMTIKEIAEILKVSQDLVLNKAKEYFPEIIQNGKKTYLTEKQTTIIKLDIEKNPYLRQSSELPKTVMEKEIIIQQALIFQNEKIQSLQKENEILKPKAEYYDFLVERDLLTNLRDTAIQIGLTQNVFIQKLLDDGYVYKNIHGKYRSMCNSYCAGLFALKDFINSNGYKDKQLLITVEGKKYFLNKYGVKK